MRYRDFIRELLSPAARNAKAISDATRRKSEALHDYQAALRNAAASKKQARRTGGAEQHTRIASAGRKCSTASTTYQRKLRRANDAIRAALGRDS